MIAILASAVSAPPEISTPAWPMRLPAGAVTPAMNPTKMCIRDSPRSLDEAAQVDGCHPIGAMIRVVLPVTLPGIIATGIYIFITSWNEYLYASVLAGQDVRVLTVAVQTLIGEYEIAWGLLTAGGVVGALPVTLLFMFIQKRLISGMTQGAVKG